MFVDVAAVAAQATTPPGRNPAELERFARNLFATLVNRDFIAVSLTPRP